MIIRFGLDVPIHKEFSDPKLLSTLAVEAERAGWEGFFIQDAMISKDALVDPWIALAAIAVRTERIRLGALLTALPRRRPWKVARETATLDHLSRGRLVFGAGLGFNPQDFTAFGEPGSLAIRASQLDEGLELLARFWTGEEVNFIGDYYQIAGVTIRPRPFQRPQIPIWIGGGWPKRGPFRRAARWDGVYVMTEKSSGGKMMPADIRAMVAFIADQRTPTRQYDVVFADRTPADPGTAGRIVQPYAAAGVTWWLEGLWSLTPAEACDRIRSGPPVLL